MESTMAQTYHPSFSLHFGIESKKEDSKEINIGETPSLNNCLTDDLIFVV